MVIATTIGMELGRGHRVLTPRLPFKEARVKLSDIPKPDFIDHFPRTAEGHGAQDKYEKGESGQPGQRISQTCVAGRCDKGDSHVKGRSGNAAIWMRAVRYDGPSPGIEEEKEQRRRDRGEVPIEVITQPTGRCKDGCQERGRVHSVCVLAPPLKVKLLARMLAKVDALDDTLQAARILGEYAGVERVMQRAEEVRA